jgi:hypothetical protein
VVRDLFAWFADEGQPLYAPCSAASTGSASPRPGAIGPYSAAITVSAWRQLW